MRKSKLDEMEPRGIRALFAKHGNSVAAVAKDAGCSWGSAKKWREKLGLDNETPTGPGEQPKPTSTAPAPLFDEIAVALRDRIARTEAQLTRDREALERLTGAAA